MNTSLPSGTPVLFFGLFPHEFSGIMTARSLLFSHLLLSNTLFHADAMLLTVPVDTPHNLVVQIFAFTAVFSARS